MLLISMTVNFPNNKISYYVELISNIVDGNLRRVTAVAQNTYPSYHLVIQHCILLDKILNVTDFTKQ